jgi:hypothetical protein
VGSSSSSCGSILFGDSEGGNSSALGVTVDQVVPTYDSLVTWEGVSEIRKRYQEGQTRIDRGVLVSVFVLFRTCSCVHVILFKMLNSSGML